MINNYVISLDHAEARHDHIQKMFAKHDVSFQFSSAVTPETYEAVKAQLAITASDGKLSPSEVACFLSHAWLWQKMIDEDLALIGIFEDDIHFGADARALLNNTDWVIPDTVTRLEVHNKRIKIHSGEHGAKSHPVLKDRQLYSLASLQMGAAGYLISKSAAKIYLEEMRALPELIAVDHFLFEQFLSVYPGLVQQLNPAVVVQDDLFASATRHYRLPNYLEGQRGVRIDKPNRSMFFKLKREMARLFIQLWKVLTYKKIYFE